MTYVIKWLRHGQGSSRAWPVYEIGRAERPSRQSCSIVLKTNERKIARSVTSRQAASAHWRCLLVQQAVSSLARIGSIVQLDRNWHYSQKTWIGQLWASWNKIAWRGKKGVDRRCVLSTRQKLRVGESRHQCPVGSCRYTRSSFRGLCVVFVTHELVDSGENRGCISVEASSPCSTYPRSLCVRTGDRRSDFSWGT